MSNKHNPLASNAEFVAVLRPSLVDLTGTRGRGLALSQLIYWTPKTKDHKVYWEEELRRAKGVELEGEHGFIAKTGKALGKEIHYSETGAGKVLRELTALGYISARNNPKTKMIRTRQYRVNLVKLVEDLTEQELSLGGFPKAMRVEQIQSAISSAKLLDTLFPRPLEP